MMEPGQNPQVPSAQVGARAAAKMHEAADALRGKAPIAEDSRIGSLAHAGARGLDRAAEFVARQGTGSGAGDLVSPVVNMIRRYPFQSLAVGAGIGFILGRMVGGNDE